ncbi:hypothetical protein HOA92_04430 [archaeon]|jgi:hypothetical protein|nr:hypothetical protein [archaeon]MBT6762262.1 hypothetical protein [archaeon]
MSSQKGIVKRSSLNKVTLSTKKFLEIIAYADALQRFDERRTDEKLLSTIADSLSPNEEVSLIEIYQVAKELSISEKYIQRALSISHPTAEKQLADIINHGAIPTTNVIFSTYKKQLFDALSTNIPIYKFTISSEPSAYTSILYFYKLTEEDVKKRFLFWEETERIQTYDPLAELRIGSDIPLGIPNRKFTLRIKLQDPLFLDACGDELQKLNQVFKDQMHTYDIRHDYKIE